MKQPWDPVSLTVQWWHGKHPAPGDGLRTKTGRLYLIQGVVRKRNGLVGKLRCLVLPKDESVPGRIFEWEWGPRKRARSPRSLTRRSAGRSAE